MLKRIDSVTRIDRGNITSTLGGKSAEINPSHILLIHEQGEVDGEKQTAITLTGGTVIYTTMPREKLDAALGIKS